LKTLRIKCREHGIDHWPSKQQQQQLQGALPAAVQLQLRQQQELSKQQQQQQQQQQQGALPAALQLQLRQQQEQRREQFRLYQFEYRKKKKEKMQQLQGAPSKVGFRRPNYTRLFDRLQCFTDSTRAPQAPRARVEFTKEQKEGLQALYDKLQGELASSSRHSTAAADEAAADLGISDAGAKSGGDRVKMWFSNHKRALKKAAANAAKDALEPATATTAATFP
jgi:hypothetical protein